jgi:predicted nucleotidyltransferase
MKKVHDEFMRVVDDLVKSKVDGESIQAIVLGGSVARGDEEEHSDIDIVFYVERRDLPESLRNFYEFEGKYIEEHYLAIENFCGEDVFPEARVLYDVSGKVRERKFDLGIAKKKFDEDLKGAKRSQKMAESFFEKGKYEEVFSCLYDMESPSFILMHALPARFDLPFPSFRLLKSIKIIDEKNGSRLYDKLERIYGFENNDYEEILRIFESAYKLVGEFRDGGFFDRLKIKYNIDGLRRTFEEYPFVYAYRFIVGCLASWAFNEGLGVEVRGKLRKNLFEVLGAEGVDEGLVKGKLELSRKLISECEGLE